MSCPYDRDSPGRPQMNFASSATAYNCSPSGNKGIIKTNTTWSARQKLLSPLGGPTYLGMHATDPKVLDVARIWDTKVPTKIKFFGRLLHFALGA